MRINAVRNYNYGNNESSSSVNVNKSPSFRELHFDKPLINYCRRKAIPIDKLQKAKLNTKLFSKAIFDAWLKEVENWMYAGKVGAYDIANKVCESISNELYGFNKEEITRLATDKKVRAIYKEYSGKLKQEASAVFDKHGKDFEIDVYDGNDHLENFSSKPNNHFYFNVPGLGKVSYWYPHVNGRDYDLKNVLDNIIKGKIGSFFRENANNKSAPELIKDIVRELNEVKTRLEEEYKQKIEGVIKPMAREVIEHDEYEMLA